MASDGDAISAIVGGIVTLLVLGTVIPPLLGVLNSVQQTNYDSIRKQVELEYQQQLQEKDLQIQHLLSENARLRDELARVLSEYNALKNEKVTKGDIQLVLSELNSLAAEISTLKKKLSLMKQTYISLTTIVTSTYKVTLFSLSLYVSVSLVSAALLAFDIFTVAAGGSPKVTPAVGSFLRSVYLWLCSVVASLVSRLRRKQKK